MFTSRIIYFVLAQDKECFIVLMITHDIVMKFKTQNELVPNKEIKFL